VLFLQPVSSSIHQQQDAGQLTVELHFYTFRKEMPGRFTVRLDNREVIFTQWQPTPRNKKQTEVRERLLFGAESFVFQFAIQKFKDCDIQNYNFAYCFIWV
jgi:hypothetical protein